jgi:1-deoxy-D-xylulose-5-phosphate synthase
MGLYDIAYLMAVPNVTVTAPKDGAEMLALLRLGVEDGRGPLSLRYPRDSVPAAVPALADIPRIEFGTWEVLRRGEGIALLATGTMVHPALAAARELEADGIDATVVNCRFLKPFDETTLEWVRQRHRAIVTVEEGTIVNGFGAALARRIGAGDAKTVLLVDVMGVPDRLIEHASRSEQLAEVGLDSKGIAERARRLAAAARIRAVRETA